MPVCDLSSHRPQGQLLLRPGPGVALLHLRAHRPCRVRRLQGLVTGAEEINGLQVSTPCFSNRQAPQIVVDLVLQSGVEVPTALP